MKNRYGVPLFSGTQSWPAGVILAGGQSSRFGSNKALAHHRGRPLIVHVATTLAPLFSQRLLVTNEPCNFAFVGWPMTADRITGAGPLAGIQAALRELTADRIFVTACDMPLLDGKIIERLCNCPGDWDVVLPALARGREPLHAVYHRRILPQLEAALDCGDYRLTDLLAKLRVREMSGSELGIGAGKSSSFVNINYRRDLENLASSPLSWQQASRLIREAVSPDDPETVELADALDRIPAAPVRARLAVPSFPQSCRDGYALRAADCAPRPGTTVVLRIKGEIAAGAPPPAKLQAGESYRIMTGGLVPPGADTVVPFEEVQRQGRQSITLATGPRSDRHIRPPGSELGRGRVVARAGRVIAPEHLALLATAGCEQLEVFRRPRVGILCTGNELVSAAAPTPPPGSLISGNRLLLAGLVKRYGGQPVDLGTVGDDTDTIIAALAEQRRQGLRLLITTGGLGPGKYDLVAGALEKLGAAILYRELKVRPGKATLAAQLDQQLIFGLPGPPPAVHLLFHLLIGPALNRARGLKQAGPALLRLPLAHPVRVRRRGMLHLKEGVMTAPPSGRPAIRSPQPGEALNAVLLVPANRRQLKAGELVRTLLVP